MAREMTPYQLAWVFLAAVALIGAAPRAKLEKAVVSQRERVAEEPGNPGALNDLGNLLAEMGETEEAEEAYRQAVAMGPERPEPPYNLALMVSDKRPREARRLLEAMLKDHPDHAWGHYQLGSLQQARGSRSRALRHYRKAFRLDTRLTDPRYNPHVLDNSLATAAMLEAFSEETTVGTGQRLYAEPNRVSGLLLPPLSAEPELPMEEVGQEPAEEPAEEESEG